MTIAKKLSIECGITNTLEDINQINYNQINKYFNTPGQDKIEFTKIVGSNYNYNYNINNASLICKVIDFKKQKQISTQDKFSQCDAVNPSVKTVVIDFNGAEQISKKDEFQQYDYKQEQYEVSETNEIKILEQKQPEYETKKIDNINITEEKKCTEDKDIQTENVQLAEKEVQVNIEDKPKKVVQKPKKKFNWNFNHFQSKDKFCSFERIGDIFGYRNPSNLMISSGKSPFRNYNKNKDVGIGKKNNQGWRI